MTKNSPLRLIQFCVVSGLLVLTPLSHAATTLLSTSKYAVTEGVAFTILNGGASNFLFSWTDSPGFSSVSDPTLVLVIGQTYTFQRTAPSTAHPFAIMDNSAFTSLSIAGSDGSYARANAISGTTSEATASQQQMTAAINAATLFTALPSPTNNIVSWTPSQVGDYWYTCTVTTHGSMTGKITVASSAASAVPEPGTLLPAAALVMGALLRRRRGRAHRSGRATA